MTIHPDFAADPAPLFSPLTIGPLTVPNRFVMAPMTRSLSPGGLPGADVAGYYARRAAGGVGLIVTEGVYVDTPSGPRTGCRAWMRARSAPGRRW